MVFMRVSELPFSDTSTYLVLDCNRITSHAINNFLVKMSHKVDEDTKWKPRILCQIRVASVNTETVITAL